MQNQNSLNRTRGRIAVAAALASLSLFGLAASSALAINNPFSAFPVDTDAHYGTTTNPNEWSDITPAWFISNASGAHVTFAGDPNANSLLFAGVAKDLPTPAVPNPAAELYLMYDYLPRTVGPTFTGEFLGDVTFPMTINGQKNQIITVQVRGDLSSPTGLAFTVALPGGSVVPASALGMEGAAGPGTTPVNALWGVTAASPFHTTFHELIELGVPLDLPAGFATPGGPLDTGSAGGGGGGGYSPDPAFWSSNIGKNPGNPDPPASGGLFQIQPDGSTIITPHDVLPAVPTPGALISGGALLCMLGARRLTRRKA